MSDDKDEDQDSKHDTSWLNHFRQMWRELPVRHKFHGFCLLLCVFVFITTLLRTENLIAVAGAGGLFALLLVPVIVEAFLSMGDRKLPVMSATDRQEIRALCQKIQELEQNTSLVLKLDGPGRLFKEFPRLFPYAGDNPGGIVSRFAAMQEPQAARLLVQMHDILRQLAS